MGGIGHRVIGKDAARLVDAVAMGKGSTLLFGELDRHFLGQPCGKIDARIVERGLRGTGHGVDLAGIDGDLTQGRRGRARTILFLANPARRRPAHIDQLLVGTGRDRDGAGERADGGDGAEHPVDSGLGLFRHQITAVGIGLGGQLGLDLEITQAGIDTAPEEAVEGLGMFGLVGVSRATHPADLERCQRGIGLVEGLLQGGDLGIDAVDLFGLDHIGHAGPDVGEFLVALDLEVLEGLLQFGQDFGGVTGFGAHAEDTPDWPAATGVQFDTHLGSPMI